MRTAFALSIAALAGSALASPYYSHNKEVKNVHVVVETVVHTVYITEGYGATKSTHTRTRHSVSSAAAVTTVTSEKPASSSAASSVSVAPVPVASSSSIFVSSAPAASSSATYEASVPATTTSASAATTTITATSTSAAATSTGYMSIVDTWRSKMGLTALTNSAKLESNAMDCVVSSNGEMVHKLNSGSYAQVLAPGTADDFEHVFVGGWLCEISTLAGLDGICATESVGWSYDGQTGHAEILTSSSYSEIGCALYAGIWACDLA